jgi:hypothetical protein
LTVGCEILLPASMRIKVERIEKMKKLLITAMTLVVFASPSFAAQSEEGMNLREMRRMQYFMMKNMMDANMMYMKSQEEMMKHFADMLQKMIECEDKNLRDGQAGC